jgi:iron complex outermembrane receptor protein
MDTPQSVQVIGAEIITQQQAIRLVIKNINGVYVGSARGGAQESFSRGYDMSANNMFKMVFVLIADLKFRPKVEVRKCRFTYGNGAEF